MLYSDLSGNRVTDGSFRVRFLLIFFSGLVALGSVIYWRSQLLISQEYVDFPQYKAHHHAPTLTAKESTNEQD
jgi:hypothetical protein